MVYCAVSSNFERYLGSNLNKSMIKTNHYLGLFDDGVFKLGEHSARLGRYVADLTGDSKSALKCESVAECFGSGRAVIGAVRFIPESHKILTGQTFFETDDLSTSGQSISWRKVRHKNGAPVEIPRHELLDGTWKRGPHGWKKGSDRSIDGKYIEDLKGERICRPWLSIIMDILAIVARILTPVRLLHTLKVINLGKHAQKIGGAITGIWGAVTTLNCVQSFLNLTHETDVNAIQKRAWESFHGFWDLAALPFDCGIGSAHPILAAVGAGINIVSAVSTLAKEIVYYG